MSDARRYLLYQIRNADDPMRRQEAECFAWALGCEPSRITTHDLLRGAPPRQQLDRHDLVLLGGSGDYSAASRGAGETDGWLNRAFDALRELHTLSKPTFASCWGFQAFCRALGGDCVHDLLSAELGQVELTLTADGREDPVFGQLPATFLAHAGHEDRVTTLPSDAVLLASTDRVAQQAIRFDSKPIYATQFHPELTARTFLQRVEAYPKYVEKIARMPFERFCEACRETPEANQLARRIASLLLD